MDWHRLCQGLLSGYRWCNVTVHVSCGHLWMLYSRYHIKPFGELRVHFVLTSLRSTLAMNLLCLSEARARQSKCMRGGLVSHYSGVVMGAIASQITSLTIVYSTIYSDADQRKHQSSASLAFVRGIHRGPVNSPHKWPVTRKMFPFDDVIMIWKKRLYVFVINAWK